MTLKQRLTCFVAGSITVITVMLLFVNPNTDAEDAPDIPLPKEIEKRPVDNLTPPGDFGIHEIPEIQIPEANIKSEFDIALADYVDTRIKNASAFIEVKKVLEELDEMQSKALSSPLSLTNQDLQRIQNKANAALTAYAQTGIDMALKFTTLETIGKSLTYREQLLLKMERMNIADRLLLHGVIIRQYRK